MKLMYLWWLAVAVIVLISPVSVWVDYRHRGKTEDTLLFQVGVLWGLQKFSVQVPVISSSSRGISVQAEAGKVKKSLGFSVPSLQEIKQYLAFVKRVKGTLRRFFNLCRRIIKVRQFVWHTEIGIDDSARLAQMTGALWAVKGMVSAGLYRMFKFSKQPVFRVRPHFNRSYFRTVFTCILEFPLGYAIIAAFFAGYLVIKLKLSKRGEVNVRTSNPRPDEDSHGKYQRDGRCQYSNR